MPVHVPTVHVPTVIHMLAPLAVTARASLTFPLSALSTPHPMP